MRHDLGGQGLAGAGWAVEQHAHPASAGARRGKAPVVEHGDLLADAVDCGVERGLAGSGQQQRVTLGLRLLQTDAGMGLPGAACPQAGTDGGQCVGWRGGRIAGEVESEVAHHCACLDRVYRITRGQFAGMVAQLWQQGQPQAAPRAGWQGVYRKVDEGHPGGRLGRRAWGAMDQRQTMSVYRLASVSGAWVGRQIGGVVAHLQPHRADMQKSQRLRRGERCAIDTPGDRVMEGGHARPSQQCPYPGGAYCGIPTAEHDMAGASLA
ncbi:hypothetical protein SDC9_136941 [bioreactor metagenome]|uniref:Uncharacterized protein n=1 Tax=bioreactor metagenome TaxID=1076179 RepID=A0A645DKJ3_9ZZZZ